MRVGLFVTCLIDLMRPEIGFSVIKLIEAAGFEVIVPPAQTCCGQPAYASKARGCALTPSSRNPDQEGLSVTGTSTSPGGNSTLASLTRNSASSYTFGRKLPNLAIISVSLSNRQP